MRPAIKAGDILLGEPVGESPARVGEVVLLRAGEGHPVVHRLIARRRDREDWLYITGGDATSGLDHIQPGSVVLARVGAIERAGQRLPIGRTSPAAIRRLRAWWRLLLHGRVGPRHPLRTVPSSLVSLARSLRNFALGAIPSVGRTPAVASPPSALGEELTTEVRSVSRWRQGQTYIVNVYRQGRAIGRAHLARAYRRELKLETWWIINLHTRRRFRGRGVGARAVEACLDVARQHGIERVFAAVDERNAASLALFVSAGFRRAEDAALGEAIGRVHKRRLMIRARLVVLSRVAGEPPTMERERAPANPQG